jgi:hypothetical protein
MAAATFWRVTALSLLGGLALPHELGARPSVTWAGLIARPVLRGGAGSLVCRGAHRVQFEQPGEHEQHAGAYVHRLHRRHVGQASG